MPDFEALVRDRLQQWRHHQREEVIRELAAHMQDRYADLLREGTPPQEALRATLSGARDWDRLRHEIASAKRGTMADRANGIWIPGLIALAIVVAGGLDVPFVRVGAPYGHGYWFWITFQRVLPIIAGAAAMAYALFLAADDARRVWIPGTISLLIVMASGWLFPPMILRSPMSLASRFMAGSPHLTVAIVAGAAAAAWSLFSGGTRRQRLCAAEFPAIYALLTALMRFPAYTTSRFALGLVFAFFIPAVALLLGAAPFLVGKPPRHEIIVS